MNPSIKVLNIRIPINKGLENGIERDLFASSLNEGSETAAKSSAIRNDMKVIMIDSIVN